VPEPEKGKESRGLRLTDPYSTAFQPCNQSAIKSVRLDDALELGQELTEVLGEKAHHPIVV
jgi:hypothetical protein